MNIINEAYFGRAPVAPLQKQLSIIREKVLSKKIGSQPNVDPDVIKFNRLAEKIFGFNSFSLYILPTMDINAYTFPVDMYYSNKEKKDIIRSLAANPHGFNYTDAFNGVSIIVTLFMGVIMLDTLTDEELMACVLHEIGHGFFLAVTSEDTAYTSSRKLSSVIIAINDFILNKIKKNNNIIAIDVNTIEKDLDTFTPMIDDVKSSIGFVKSSLSESMRNNMRFTRIDYTNEKFADSFAAMYGYGEACASLLNKITYAAYNMYNDGRPIKKNPHIIEVLKMYTLYLNDLINYIMCLQDPHPANLARMKTTAEYLRREISKETMDPKIKKELIGELNKVYKIIEQYQNVPADEDVMRIVRLYHNKLYEKFGGDRRERDTDNKALFDFIDKRYENLMKIGKKG